MEALEHVDFEEYEDGDTLPLPVLAPSQTKGGRALLAMFEAPPVDAEVVMGTVEAAVEAAAAPAPAKVVEYAPAPLSPAVITRKRPCAHVGNVTSHRLPRALCCLVLTLVLTTAAAFACSARGSWNHGKASCGDLGASRSFVRRSARRKDPEDRDDEVHDVYDDDDVVRSTPLSESEARKAMALLLHQDPSADPEDYMAIVAKTSAEALTTLEFSRTAAWWEERSKPSEEPSRQLGRAVPSPRDEVAVHEELARVAQARGLSVALGDLGLQAHILKRLRARGVFDAHPEMSLLDGVTAAEGRPYYHAHERTADYVEPDAAGNYDLDLYSWILDDMEREIHENPSIDLADLVAIKMARDRTGLK